MKQNSAKGAQNLTGRKEERRRHTERLGLWLCFL